MVDDQPYARPVTRPLLLLLLCCAGCDRLDGVGVVLTDRCEQQSALALHPAGGEAVAWVGGWVWADIACADPGVLLSVAQDGAPVAGETEVAHGGLQARFAPDAPLQPGTLYDARVDTDVGFVSWQFTTSALGGPVGSDLSERALALFPDQAGVLEPAGFLSELPRLLLDTAHPVVQFLGEPSGGGIALRLGARQMQAVSSPQDPAVTTEDVIASWADPMWTAGPVDLAFPGQGYTIVLEDVTLSGAVAPGVAWGGGGMIAGRWDLREAGGGLSPEFASPCVVNNDAGGEGCVACRDGAVACLNVDLRDVPALAWGGVLQ